MRIQTTSVGSNGAKESYKRSYHPVGGSSMQMNGNSSNNQISGGQTLAQPTQHAKFAKVVKSGRISPNVNQNPPAGGQKLSIEYV